MPPMAAPQIVQQFLEFPCCEHGTGSYTAMYLFSIADHFRFESSFDAQVSSENPFLTRLHFTSLVLFCIT
jgi:hypothetical protein